MEKILKDSYSLIFDSLYNNTMGYNEINKLLIKNNVDETALINKLKNDIRTFVINIVWMLE
jgi:hypothetical protein